MSSVTMSWLGLLGGLAAVGGLLGAIAATRGWGPRWRGRRVRSRGVLEGLPPWWRSRYRWLLVAAGVAGVGVWAWTGWPIHGLIAATVVAGWPFVWYPDSSAEVRVARLDALAEWLRQLASVQAAGVPLEQTIQASVDRAPLALRDPVAVLAARLRRGHSPAAAYRAFADELADGAVDNVVLMFMDHADSRGTGMARALEGLAQILAEQVSDAQGTEAERAKGRTSTRAISCFAVALVAVLILNSSYTTPYGMVIGQALLVALGAGLVAALAWLRRMTRATPTPRLLMPVARRDVEGSCG